MAVGFTPHTEQEIKEMLNTIGVEKISDLFSDIPPNLWPDFDLPAGRSEYETEAEIRSIARKNNVNQKSFLGAGYYDHFIPAAVDTLSSLPQFYTAYTPYQPEASQGTLRSIFEYQTMISRLTGLPYTNASLYDGATALYEAAAMAVRVKRRSKVVVDKGVNPLFRRVLATISANQDVEIVEVDIADFSADEEAVRRELDDQTAAVVIQSPNFFGVIEDPSGLFEYAKTLKIATIMVYYPIALGILKSPAELGADIAVAEGQSLGMPLSFGGPYLGLMSCTKDYFRKMPGRIVGKTIDREGGDAYVLTLQAREQHIRREKATSNICSNQALCALRAVIFLSLLGKRGFRDLALINAERGAMFKRKLERIDSVEIIGRNHLNEITIRLPISAQSFMDGMKAKGINAGVSPRRFYPQMEHELIVAVTEKTTESDLDVYVNAMREVIG